MCSVDRAGVGAVGLGELGGGFSGGCGGCFVRICWGGRSVEGVGLRLGLFGGG